MVFHVRNIKQNERLKGRKSIEIKLIFMTFFILWSIQILHEQFDISES